jgi:hypothetical protein
MPFENNSRSAVDQMEAGQALLPGLLSSGAVAQKYVVTVVLVPLIAGKPDLTD